MGVAYILDEPSIGLHQRDNDKLLKTLLHLRDLGNSVLVVEHDEDTMRAADCIVDGTNEDDHHVYRPGIQALKELGIVSPLAELHITKAEVKAMAKEWGISVASRPSTPCMATRLPYNTPIDYDVMKQIEVGEGYLRELLGGNVRLRLHGNVVRIEADKTSFGKLLEHGDEIVKTLKNLGFVYITMDLEGFRSGSMDVGLDK